MYREYFVNYAQYTTLFGLLCKQKNAETKDTARSFMRFQISGTVISSKSRAKLTTQYWCVLYEGFCGTVNPLYKTHLTIL